MNIPQELFYTPNHEWVRLIPGGYEMGITEFAQEQLGDLVYIDLPKVGEAYSADDEICQLESAKTAESVFAPLDGTVVAVNEQLRDTPELINTDAFAAWMVRLEGLPDTAHLLDAAAYTQVVAQASGH